MTNYTGIEIKTDNRTCEHLFTVLVAKIPQLREVKYEHIKCFSDLREHTDVDSTSISMTSSPRGWASQLSWSSGFVVVRNRKIELHLVDKSNEELIYLLLAQVQALWNNHVPAKVELRYNTGERKTFTKQLPIYVMGASIAVWRTKFRTYFVGDVVAPEDQPELEAQGAVLRWRVKN